MTKKISLFIIIFALVLAPFSFLGAQEDVAGDPVPADTAEEDILEKNLAKDFWAKTKEISKKVYEAIEVWRVNTLEVVTANKEKAKYVIDEGERKPVEDVLDEKLSGEEVQNDNIFKPWEYVKLSFFTGSEAVLKTKFVFYGILIMIVLTILLRIFK